jgi:hypothetical protein
MRAVVASHPLGSLTAPQSARAFLAPAKWAQISEFAIEILRRTSTPGSAFFHRDKIVFAITSS